MLQKFVLKNTNYRFQIIFLVICCYYSLANTTVSYASDLDIINIQVTEDNELELEVVNLTDSAIKANTKIGVSVDGSGYGYGSIYNPLENEYIKYSSRWNSTPVIDYMPGNSTLVSGLLSDEISVIDTPLYFRLRYKVLETGKISNVDSEDYDLFIGVQDGDYATRPTPTNFVTPSPAADASLENSVIPTPRIESTQDSKLEEDTFVHLSNLEKENIIISEFYPYPEKGEKEWVEIYNNNSTPVLLQNWSVDDILDGGGKSILFDADLEPYGYYLVEYDKALLNNNGDSVSLLDENSNPVHTVIYKKAYKKYSIQKINNGNFYLTENFTKGKENLNLDISNISTEKPKYTEDMSLDTLPVFKESYTDNLDTNILGETAPPVDDVVLSTVANITQEPEFRKYTYYPAEKPFAPSSSEGKIYIYTSKNTNKFYQPLIKFFEKVYW